MFANRFNQGCRRRGFRAFQLRAEAKLFALFRLFGWLSKTGREQQAVKQINLALITPRRPGDLSILAVAVDVDAVIVGDKTFVEGGEAIILQRNEHTSLDRLVWPGVEPNLCIYRPHGVGFAAA